MPIRWRGWLARPVRGNPWASTGIPDHVGMDDDRYSRQIRFAGIGAAGQERLALARVTVIGCGALGSVILDQLARAGIGCIRLVDRDIVEVSNLNRQSLYDQADAEACTPKAVAAARRLAAINPTLAYEPMVAEVDARNIVGLCRDAQVVLDGTDNFRTRHLINEACVQLGIPWVYGACVGAYGLSLSVVPGRSPCLHCLQDLLPAPGDTPTCDTSGIIAPAAHLVAAIQVAECLKMLVGTPARQGLWSCDLWLGTFRSLALADARDPDCAVCGTKPVYPMLTAPADPAVVLCGRDAVQVNLGRGLDPESLAVPASIRNAHLCRWLDAGVTLTAFADGRVLVQGALGLEQARAVVDRWCG